MYRDPERGAGSPHFDLVVYERLMLLRKAFVVRLTQRLSSEHAVGHTANEIQARIPHIDFLPLCAVSPQLSKGIMKLFSQHGRELVQVSREIVADHIHLEVVDIDILVPDGPPSLNRVICGVEHVYRTFWQTVYFLDLVRGNYDNRTSIYSGHDEGKTGFAVLRAV